jgi:light-regulated signal transduction histidine kinase (bacteriophytochrome)
VIPWFAEAAGERIRRWVKDRRIGIEPEAHRKGFELFGRNNMAKRYEGTGIGLAIVRKAVEPMGRAVGVESQLWLAKKPLSGWGRGSYLVVLDVAQGSGG